MKSSQKLVGAEIKILRPSGVIEIVAVKGMTDKLFAAAKKATLDAGRGEMLSYKMVYRDWTAEEKAFGQSAAYMKSTGYQSGLNSTMGCGEYHS